MQNWIIYGTLASLFFGINVIIFKLGSTKGLGLNPFIAALSFGIGAFILFSVFYFFKFPKFNDNWNGVILSVIAGIIWAMGLLMVSLAISKKADISRLVPLVNTNTIVAVFLGLVFLKEIPNALGVLKLIGGAVLIVIGAILVSI